MNRRLAARLWPWCLALSGAVLLAACGGPEEEPLDAGDEPLELRGAASLVEAAVGEWSLLAVPRDGGVAEARSIRDPDRVVWTGSTELPAAEEVRVLEGPLVVMRTAGGEVHRYDPRGEVLVRVGQVGPGASWTEWGRYGLFFDPDASRLLEVGGEGTWEYALAESPRWAVPVDGGNVVVKLEGEDEDASLWLVARGDSEPQSRSRGPFARPALTAAWGKRLVFASRDGDSRLRFVDVPSLVQIGEVELDGEILDMAISPSTHEIYVAVDAPPRLLAVNRFTRSVREVSDFERPLRSLRAPPLGGYLLAHDGRQVHWILPSTGELRSVEADWREDVPTGTPDDRVLLARDGEVLLWDVRAAAGPEPLSGEAGRWWAPVRWNPAPPPVVAAPVAGDPIFQPDDTVPEIQAMRPEEEGLAAADPGVEADPGVPEADPPAEEPPAEPPAEGPPPGTEERPVDAEVVPRVEAADAGDDTPGRADDLEPGFYAIVASAREPDGVRELLDRLEGAGYPTEMQEYLDDGGQTWFRGLVGSYERRESAEAAARQLQRERGLSVWVTEIRAGSTADQIFR